MSTTAATAIPDEYFVGGHNPARTAVQDPVRDFHGIPITWKTRSSYLGELPPRHLTIEGVINWLDQKTRKPPCSEELPEEENLSRFNEYKEVRELVSRLKLRRITVMRGIRL